MGCTLAHIDSEVKAFMPAWIEGSFHPITYTSHVLFWGVM